MMFAQSYLQQSLYIILVCLLTHGGQPTHGSLLTNGAFDRAYLTAAGYLFADQTDSRLNLSDAIDANLSMILDRDGPDMRPSRDYRDFPDVTLEVSKRAWTLIQEHAAIAVADRVDYARPVIEQLLMEADASLACRRSAGEVFEGAKRMETWAVKLLNSWGNFPPIGMFDGTYSEIGSFHTCVHIPNNTYIGHAQYCTITYRPVVPWRRDYELVITKESEELRHLFDHNGASQVAERNILHDLLEHSNYNHYVYYKWGTCWPIQCSPFDVKRIAKLIGRRNILMLGPVKCYSMDSEDYEQEGGVNNTTNQVSLTSKLEISIWDLNRGIFIWKPHLNATQKVALGILAAVSFLIGGLSLVDLFARRLPNLYRNLTESLLYVQAPTNNHSQPAPKTDHDIIMSRDPDALRPANQFTLSSNNSHLVTDDAQPVQTTNPKRRSGGESTFMGIVDDCSIFTNIPQFFRVSEGQLKNDILCLNGARCITMLWVLMAHSLVYNDWSAFARIREIEKAIRSPLTQPLFNASYLVDTFFLMSGLLSAFTAFKHCQGMSKKFSSVAFILNRWLRLTPQIFFVSLIYIVLPAMSSGPHWYPIVGEFSENCVDNWWINVLHLQAFFRAEKMCNFVTWWISIDYLYHFLAVLVIWVILSAGHRTGFLAMASLVACQIAWQAMRHYELRLPPNMLSTIAQTGAMWSTMTLQFFWKPYSHSVPFFVGFYTGYLMALKRKVVLGVLNNRVALIGWTLTFTSLVCVSYSTFWWVTGQMDYSPMVATLHNVVSPILWALPVCWIILACHHGYGGFINRVLSWRIFIVLAKASYMVYLTHFQVMFTFYGNQNLLLEPAPMTMLYITIGNIFLSTIYGVLLCAIFELPWLKFHKKLGRRLKLNQRE